MALKVGELFASFNLDTSGIDSAVSSAEKSLSSLGKGLTLGGAAMTAAVTVPLVNAAKDIYEAGSGFDSQMSKVFAIAGDEVTGSVEKMEALRQKALEMGSTTQFTATEAGQAFEYMAMAGWKTDSMLAAIEPLMNLAAAAGADLGSTSDIVTDAMTAFGLAATDTVRVVKDGMEMDVNAVEYFADILAAASSNSNTNVMMLGESFKFAAPLAGSLGYSLNDVAIALGLMANNGIKSSMAGTSLSRVIQNMAKPSDQTAEAMSKLGLSLYDSKGNVKSLRDLMSDFRNVAKQNGVDLAEMTQKVGALDEQFQAGKLTEEQYEAELAKLTGGSGDFLAAITQIAGARGLPGLLAIMNTTDEDFERLAYSIDNATGSASRMKQVMLDNVGGAVTIFKSAVEGLEITLWDLVKEPLPGLITKATEMVDSFRQMDKETQLGALKMGAFAAALGPVMTASGTLLMALPKIVKGIAMLSSPLGLVSVGLLALGAASMDAENLMGKNLEKMAKSAATNMKKVQKNLQFKNWVLASRGNKFLDSVKNAVEEAGPVFMDTLSAVLRTGISALGSMMPKAAEVATTTVKTITDGIARSAPGMAKTLARTLTRLATSVIGAVPDMLHAGMTLFSALIDAVGKVNWLDIGKQLNKAITDALKEIRTNFYTLVFGEEPTAEDLGDWGKLGAKITENIKAGIKTASQNGKNLIGGLVLGDDYNPDDSWGTVAGKIWNKITTAMGSFLSGAGDLIKGLVLGKDYTADASWGDVATAIWNTIKSAFTTLKTNVKDLLGTIALGEGYTADTSWESIATAIWEKIKTKFSALAASAKDIVGQLVLGEGYTADSSWGDIGQAIWDKAKAKFDTLAKSAKDLIGTLVLGSDYTADTTWENVGKAVWDKAKAGFDTLAASAKDFVGQLVLGDDYTADTSWSTIGSAVWDAAKSGFDTLAATAKDFVGKLVLGDDYTADSSWSKIGSEIWEKAKSGFSTLAATAKNIIGDLVLGDDYDPGDSWQKIGSAIWEKAKTGFSNAFTAAKDIIGTFVLGDDYDPGDTWKTIGSAIWEKAKAGFAEAFTLAKEIIGTFVLGDDYDPGDSWKKIGAAIWDKAKDGFSSAFTAAKDIIGTFALGDDYEPGDSWKKIGSGIWTKAQEGFKGAYKTAKDIIGTFALGDDYTADESWAKIGQALWDKIKEKLTALSANAKDLIGNLVYSGGEEGYTADESWADIGKKLWEKVQSGITAGKDMAAAILEKIGNVEIDVEGVMTTVKNAGTFVSNLIGNMLNGRITWGTKITDLAKKIGDKFAAYGWDNIGTTLGQVANNLITAITDAIPNAVDAAGNAIDVGLTLATGIMNSIVTAIGDSSLASGFSNLVQGLVTGIVSAVERLPEMLDNVLSVGAQVANAIMGSITSALTDMEASGIATSLGQAAVDLVHGLLTSITNFGENADVQSFMENLGKGFSAALGMLGDLAGSIVGYILSPEGLTDIFNAGISLGNLLLDGIKNVLGGLSNFFFSLLDSTLVGMGIIDQADMNAYREATQLRDTYNSALMDVFSDGLDAHSFDDYNRAMMAAVFGMGVGGMSKGNFSEAARNWLDKNASSQDAWADVINGFWSDILRDTSTKKINGEEINGDWVKDYMTRNLGEMLDFDPADVFDDSFFSTIAEWLTNGGMENQNAIMEAVMLALFGSGEENAETPVQETVNAATEGAVDAIRQSEEQVNAAVDEFGSALGQGSMAIAMRENMGEVEEAAAEVTDAAVREFLLTMSAENGKAIGEQFIGGIIAILDDGTVVSAASALGTNAYNTINAILTGAAGVGIGRNFGLGLANGIASMTSAVSNAAWNLGITAANSLNAALQINSPSKLTGESGDYFGLGFINHILDSAEGAADAAEMMGRSAGEALAYTVRGIGSEASEIRYPQAAGYTRGDTGYSGGQQNDPAIEQMTNRIIEALSHMGVYIDGEPAGHVLTPYISEEIAHSTSVRR